jgi:TolB-like protein/Tfp pilus assembly protein PilF
MQYRFADSVLDTAKFALLRGGEKTDTQPQVLKLLVYLIENRDRVVTRGELLDKLFGRRIVTDNALTVRIRDVRRAVGDTARSPQVIETIPGVGYRFVAHVDTSSHISLGMEKAAESIPGSEGADQPPATGVIRDSKPSIAILPFEFFGDGSAENTIARGLVHDIITRVARTRAMLVIARGTAFQFPSGENDVRTVGAKLGVRYVVQGAVQISGGKLRVYVGIADAETRAELWSGQYDRKIDDVLVLQDDIAKMIVAALETEVQRAEMQRSVLRPSSRLDAWSAYHRGLNHMYRFRTKECDEAEKFFRRAIDLEPDVPRPYAGLSFVNYERAYLNIQKERKSALRRAFDYATQAVSVDPKDPMGHWALSRAQFLDGNLLAARASIEMATLLNPSYATAQYFLGWIAMQLGEHETCLERIDLARLLSPYDPLIYGMLGVSAMNLALMGRSEEAMRRAKEAMVHPDLHYQAHAMGVAICSLAGDLEMARNSLETVRRVKPDYSLDDFFSVYAFQKEDDIRRITKAFERVESRLGRSRKK